MKSVLQAAAVVVVAIAAHVPLVAIAIGTNRCGATVRRPNSVSSQAPLNEVLGVFIVLDEFARV